MGYRLAAGLYTAAVVGAPHKRERHFILAIREGDELADPARLLWNPVEWREPDGTAAALADAEGQRQREPADEANAFAGSGAARDESRDDGGTLANAYTGITIVASGDTLWFIDGSFRHLKTGGVAAATASAVILDSTINGFNGTTVLAILQEMAARIVQLESDTGDIAAAMLALGAEWSSAATAITAITIPA